ncbi:MAG: M20/M25/M40 family metallo-hydrolase [Candidatus Bathyarchaeia archaeon]
MSRIGLQYKVDISRVVGDIWTSDETYRNLQTLCSFGNRFGGTPGEMKARDFVRKKFEQYGLDEVHVEEFEYVGWKHISASARIIEPVEKAISIAPYAYSARTKGEGVKGEIVFLGYNLPSTFEANKDCIRGKIPLVIHAIASESTETPNPIDATNMATKYGARALIMMTQKYGRLQQIDECQVERWSKIPVVGVSLEDGEYLRRLGRDGKVIVEMKLENLTEKMKSWNVVGEITGREKPDEQVIVAAHFDSFYIGEEGALDDAAGACTVLEIARVLAKLRVKPRRTVKFICFPLEEIGSIGSYRYVAQHLKDLKKAILMLNLDEAGSPGTKKYVVNDPHLINYLRKNLDDLGYEQMRIATEFDIPPGDEAPFLYAGVPTIWMRLGPPFIPDIDGRYSHTAEDTVDKINPRDMREAAMLATYTLLNYVNLDEPVARKRTIREVRKILDANRYTEYLRSESRWEFVERTFLTSH